MIRAFLRDYYKDMLAHPICYALAWIALLPIVIPLFPIFFITIPLAIVPSAILAMLFRGIAEFFKIIW
jgi:hypothetical protein